MMDSANSEVIMNRKAIVGLSLFIAAIAIATIVSLSLLSWIVPNQPEPTSQLPDDYRANTFCRAEGGESVTLSYTVGNSGIIHVEEGELEVGMFSSSDSDAEFLIRNVGEEENDRWFIYTRLVDGEREMNIYWQHTLQLGESVTLPTREDVTVTFAGFNFSEDDRPDPLFIVKYK